MKGMGGGRDGVEVQWELNTHYLMVVCKFTAKKTLTIRIIMIFLVFEEKYSILLNFYDTVIHESIPYLTIKFMFTYVLYNNTQLP
jgi:hypothetical protein